jgi:eukaryotic-like serine/threonine-protein kinase
MGGPRSRYKVGQVIGRGGYAMVYDAIDRETRHRVALKVLMDEAVDDVAIARLEREGRAATSINHPNVCRTIDYGLLADNRPYVAMELLEGESLRAYLRRRGKLDLEEALEIAIQTLAGLEAVHNVGVVHRDVKPENVFISWAEGDRLPTVKLLDFGNCRVIVDPNDKTLTVTGCVVGTPGYLAPEQAFGERDLDTRVDLFAVGLILFEMLTGRQAFLGRTTAELAVDFSSRLPPLCSLRYVPAALERIVTHATEQEPSMRYASAASFQHDLLEARTVIRREAMRAQPDATRRRGRAVAATATPPPSPKASWWEHIAAATFNRG